MTQTADPDVIRVLLVDDQSLFRRAIASLIDAQSDMTVVGQADDGRQGLTMVGEHRPDVVLLDMEMPVMGGLETARAITAEHPGTQVVMLTVNDDDEHFLGAIHAGVQGYLLKDLHPAELFDQIRTAVRGEAPISPRLLPRLLEHVRRSDPPAPAVPVHDGPESRLSERELEILQLAAEGLSNREIGRRLFITEGTVKNHVHNALRKLGLDNRVQATAYLVEEGLVHRPDDGRPRHP